MEETEGCKLTIANLSAEDRDKHKSKIVRLQAYILRSLRIRFIENKKDNKDFEIKLSKGESRDRTFNFNHIRTITHGCVYLSTDYLSCLMHNSSRSRTYLATLNIK